MPRTNGYSTAVVEALRAAITDAVASGLPRDEIYQMVQTAPSSHLLDDKTRYLRVYDVDEVPEGLIDLPGAMKKYGYSRQLLHLWVKHGKLLKLGLLNNTYTGDMITLYAEKDLAELKPFSSEESPTKSYTSPDERLVTYRELPPGYIDLPSAAKKYGCPLRRLQGWVKAGSLQLHGRLRAPARGGGYLVVSEEELSRRIAMPVNRGGRPRKKTWLTP